MYRSEIMMHNGDEAEYPNQAVVGAMKTLGRDACIIACPIAAIFTHSTF